MLKKIREYKINRFKEAFPDFKVSKRGNYYHVWDQDTNTRTITFSGRHSTENTLHKMGQTQEIPESKANILLLKPTGAFRLKLKHKFAFKNLTFKDLSNASSFEKHSLDAIYDIFFKGKKYEYLKQYPKFWDYHKFLQGFKSIREVKTFLGYEFISDSVFVELWQWSQHADPLLILAYMAKDKKSKRRLLKLLSCVLEIRSKNPRTLLTGSQYLLDYYQMANQLGHPFVMPVSEMQLGKMHDDLVDKLNSAKLQDFSDDRHKYKGNILKNLESSELEYRLLDSPRKIFRQGSHQRHCLGSYTDQLDTYLFFSVISNDEYYDAQVSKQGKLIQFYGKCNTAPPAKLREEVTKCLSPWEYIGV